jgi:hypothetical protein
MRIVVLVLLLAALLALAKGAIFTYNVNIPPNYYSLARTTSYAAGDAPATGAPGNGETWVELDFELLSSGRGGRLDLFIVEHSYVKDYVGYFGALCCSNTLYRAGLCSSPGSAIVKPSADGGVIIVPPVFFGNDTTVAEVVHRRYSLPLSGFYYMYIVNCAPPDSGVARVTGHATWMNPYGYLPGSEFPFLYLFLGILGVYIVAAVVWFVLLVRYKEDILLLQLGITGALALSLLESALFFFYYHMYNQTGDLYLPLYVGGLVLDSLRITVSALVLLAVARGYLVVHENLGTPAQVWGVCFGAFVYWMLSMASEVLWFLYENTPLDLSESTIIVLQLAVKIMVASYFAVLFGALSTTVHTIRDSNEQEKKKLYVSLLLLLILAAVVSVIVMVTQLVVQIDTPLELGLWRYGWFWEAFWQLLYMAMLIALASLLRPNANNKRYAYIQVDTSVPMQSVGAGAPAEAGVTQFAATDNSLDGPDDEDLPAVPPAPPATGAVNSL